MTGVKYILAAFVLASSVFVSAQETNIYTTDVSHYRKGLELFQKEKYGAAQRHFQATIHSEDDADSEISVISEYYNAICALELFNKDAEYLLTEFIRNHPESPKVKSVYYQLGRYSYRKRKWDKVIAWFAKVDIYDLTNDELGEYYFKLGYSHFMEEDFESAGTALYEIRDVDTRYTAPARYYYAHVAYNQGNYQSALETFEKIQSHEKFSPIVPYYIAQIYYKQGKFHLLADYATPLLEKSTSKREPEIARLIGEAYYNTDRYKEAVPYLELYHNRGYGHSREDEYQLGYAYYKGGEFSKAEKQLRKLAYGDDEIAQTTVYYLADIYMKEGKKKHARTAFKQASELDHDENIKQNSLFNYAKLSYEIGYDPYNTAITSFQQYIEKYPDSELVDEAYSYIVNIYLTTKNYKAAMTSMEYMEELDERLKGAYQRVAYNRGVELYNSRQYMASISAFQKSHIYPEDQQLNSMRHYWVAECYYRLKKYDKAIEEYEAFIFEPGSEFRKEFNLAHYNIGYAHFEKEDYPGAIQSFRSFTGYKKERDQKKLNDAYLRIGDAYFIQQDYSNAADYYGRAIDMNQLEVDYAMYQRAIALGVLKRNDQKVQLLERMLAEHPKSDYAVDSRYHLGKAYEIQGNTEGALSYYDQVLDDYPTSPYVKKAKEKKGMLLRNMDRDEEALLIFQQIVDEYPTYEDSKESIQMARKIYIDQGRIPEFKEWIATLEFYNETNAALDSASYESAYGIYVKENCEQAKKDFTQYLKDYETPVYALNAHFYKAQCEFEAREYKQALEDYEHVLDQPNNSFTEAAVVNSAWINYKFGRYKYALSNYDRMEKVSEDKSNVFAAKVGQMRCFYELEQYSPAMEYGEKVLLAEKLDDNLVLEAHMIIARSARELEDLAAARAHYGEVIELTSNDQSAEAEYTLAEMDFAEGQYDPAEKKITNIVSNASSHTWWVSKAMILLADIYMIKDDSFQAKAILSAVLQKHNGDELAGIAQAKLDEVMEAERQTESKQQQEDIEIDFNGDEFDSLFDEEIDEDE